MTAKNKSYPIQGANHAQLRSPHRWLIWLFILAIVIGPRLTDLDIFIARDELAIWSFTDDFILAVWNGDLAATLTESDYPGIPMFWGQTLYLAAKHALASMFQQTPVLPETLFEERTLELLAERRLVVGLLVSVQILAAVWMVQRLFGWQTGLLSAIFMGLDPFSLTEARVLRLEMISDYFVCLTILAYFIYLRGRHRRWVLVSGVMAGLGVSSKTSAGLVVPYIWLLLLLDLLISNWGTNQAGAWLSSRPFKRVISDGLLWAAGAVGAFWLVWPAMWVQPLEAIRYVFQLGLTQAADRSVWGDTVFFWGQILPGDPGPFFYPVVLAFRTTPLSWIGIFSALMLAGTSVYQSKAAGKQALSWPVIGTILLLVYVLLMNIELSFIISKVDRFLLIIFPALNILSAIGLAALIGWLVDRAAGWFTHLQISRNLLTVGGIVLVLGIQLAIVLPAHPHYFSYWNPWVGGGRTAMVTVPMGSGEGIDLAMAFLNDLPHAKEASVICGASKPWCEGKFIGTTLRSATYVSGEWVTADYASFYISGLQRQAYPAEIVDFFMAREPLAQVDLGGATYVWLYDVPDMGHFAGAWNDLTGLGRLLGYDFGNPESKAGDEIMATVWWVNTGAGVDNLVVRLVDRNNYELTSAAIAPLPEYEAILPDEQAVVAGTANVTIPPGIPPGDYFWKVSILSTNGTQLLGEFNLPGDSGQLVLAPGEIISDPSLFDITMPVNQPLAPEVTLLGYTPPAQFLTAQEPAWLKLYWQATASPPDYEILLRLLDGTGQEIIHWQGTPGQSRYPTSRWRPGEIVQDVWSLQVQPDTPVGQYSLEISLFDPTQPESKIQNSKFKIQNLEIWSQPVRYAVSEMQTELGADFGEQLTLLGYDLYFDTDGSQTGALAPVLYWQSQTDFAGTFELLLTLRDAASDKVITTWQVPLGVDGAQAFWKADEVIGTGYRFEIEPMTGAGYHLDIALRNQETGQIEAVSLSNGSETDYIRIEDIQDKTVVRVKN